MSNKTKILMCGNHHSNKGGMTTVINQILEKDWSKDEIEIKFIPTYYRSGKLLTILFFVFGYFRVFIANIFFKPTVFYTHMSVRGSFIRTKALKKLCNRFDVPVVVHLHGSEFEEWYKSESAEKQKDISDFISDCDAFIVLGQKWERFVREIVPTAKIRQIHNCIKIPDTTVKWDDSIIRFLFLGVLIPRKGVLDLLKAIKLLEEQNEINQCEFDIAGTGSEEETLRHFVEDNSLTDKVRFLGWVSGEEKNKAIEKSMVLVLPSYNEGLPVSVLEAMSYGLPIISTNVGDIADAVYDNVNGCLIEPGDVKALAEAIIRTMDKNTWTYFSEESKKIAIKRFDINQFYSELISTWKSVIK